MTGHSPVFWLSVGMGLGSLLDFVVIQANRKLRAWRARQWKR